MAVPYIESRPGADGRLLLTCLSSQLYAFNCVHHQVLMTMADILCGWDSYFGHDYSHNLLRCNTNTWGNTVLLAYIDRWYNFK